MKTTKDIPRNLPVSIPDLREIRTEVEMASKLIHSNVRIFNDDKVKILSRLKVVKKKIDDILQLELFTDEQLDG